MPVIFTGYSGPTLAMAPLATRKKVLLVNAGAQADKLATASPYLINTLPTIGDEIKVMSKYLVGEGKKKAAILFENDAAGIAGRDDYLKSFPEAGGTIVAQEPTQFGQTDFRPALLKLADAKPDVMLVSITAGLLQMAQEYKQLDLNFTVAGTTFFADPSTIADPSSTGFVHTQVRIDAPPDLAAQFKAKYGADMEFFAQQYYNAAQIVLTTLDKVLADDKPVTGETMHDTLFADPQVPGADPAGVQDQHRHRADRHQRDARRQGRAAEGDEAAIVAGPHRCCALQLLVNGLVTGCALGVVAISFSLVYATTKIFHVAHAGIYTLGGYLAWSLIDLRACRCWWRCWSPIAACTAAGRADPEPALRAAGSGGARRIWWC